MGYKEVWKLYSLTGYQQNIKNGWSGYPNPLLYTLNINYKTGFVAR